MESILSNPILANQDRFDLNKIMNLIMMFYVFRIVRLILIIVTLSYFWGAFGSSLLGKPQYITKILGLTTFICSKIWTLRLTYITCSQ